MTNEELARLIKQGNNDLMLELYEQNRRFIFALIKHIGIQPDNYDDAMQDAYFGLHTAVQGYDESKGYKFLTYAKYHIQVSIQRGQNNALHVPEQVRDTARKIMLIQNQLTQKFNRSPAVAELAVYTGIDIKTITDILNAVKPVKSIYEPLNDDTDTLTIADSIADKSVTFENDIAAADEACYIRTVTENTLTGAEKEAVILFYFKGMTYTKIAELKQITAAEARNFIANGLRKLRKPKILKQLIESYIDSCTPFYRYRGLDKFKTTWTSSTEQAVIEREHINRQLCNKQKIT